MVIKVGVAGADSTVTVVPALAASGNLEASVN
jgi:hypothetical protein